MQILKFALDYSVCHYVMTMLRDLSPSLITQSRNTKSNMVAINHLWLFKFKIIIQVG